MAVLNGFFLLEGSAIHTYLPIAEQMREGKFRASDWVEGELPESSRAIQVFVPHAAELGLMGYESLADVPAGSVAVHTIEGVMMEADTCWSLGTQSLGRLIQQADAHESIVAHVGRFNTPGGSTSGLETFASIIAGTQKPFVSYAQQMCSAGYWAGSGANGGIVVGGRTAMLGSIGTKVSFRDYSNAMAAAGVVDHDIAATKSTNKNAAFEQAVKGNYKPIRQQLLDPLNEVFLDTVRQNRAGKLDSKLEDELLSGMVYIGEANVQNGLADRMGTFEDAVQLALDMVRNAAENGGSTPKNATNSTANTMFGKNKFSALTALAGLTGAAVTTPLVEAANDQLEEAGITGVALVSEAAYTELVAKAGRTDTAEAAVATAQKEATDAKAAQKTAEDAVAAAEKRAGEAEAEMERLAEQPGATVTNPRKSKEKNDVEGEASANDHQKTVDALHAKMLGEG
ncbi:S49 family peptidase [Hymenobacter yonginensis]|uniref:S49 family peptidase n=1 Tax=Hymenobacter yonginensis TaxID=748197 RepID=A0ABY7PTL7_9BACT|nr:S49 family peptidase [Hymenobacter yonginensis]WBO86260.1 S49 family peptidase [Hymenobacter yonginensis]